jgi:hypothetical protein
MNKFHFKRSYWGAAAGALLLAACGGGGGGGSAVATDPLVAGTDIPNSATVSAVAAFNFVNSTAATSSDTAEPLVVGDATLATSDTDEPTAL